MMIRLLFLSALLLMPAVAPAAAPDASLAGEWHGSWTRDGDAVPVIITFTGDDGHYAGSFDSDALQAAGIPIGAISDIDGKIHFEVKGDESTTVFDGVVAIDALSGGFTEDGAKGSFDFTRAVAPAPPIRTEEVTFNDHDAVLSGTLLLPRGDGRHAAILFLQGSGPEGRWANLYLARKFAEAGIAALIYDKRGVGRSTGDWRTSGFGDLSSDAAAGIRLLRARADVDAAKVGIYGHSQGGTIAPLVAERAGGLGFVIAASAGGIDPAAVETYSVGNSIGLAKLAPGERRDARAYLDEVIAVAYRGAPRAPLNAMAARFKDRDWFFAPPPPDNSYWSISRQIASYRPADHWRRVKAPVLLVYGAHDERVPPHESIAAITAALNAGGNRKLTVRTYPRADHSFFIVDPLRTGGWPRHEPDYATTLTHWVQALG